MRLDARYFVTGTQLEISTDEHPTMRSVQEAERKVDQVISFTRNDIFHTNGLIIIHWNILHQVMSASNLQSESTKTKTPAELQLKQSQS